jgi:hypothetical protein
VVLRVSAIRQLQTTAAALRWRHSGLAEIGALKSSGRFSALASA